MGAGYRSLLTQELCNFEDTWTLCSILGYIVADRVEHLVMENVLFCVDPEKPTADSSAIALAALISVSCLTCYLTIFVTVIFLMYYSFLVLLNVYKYGHLF